MQSYIQNVTSNKPSPDFLQARCPSHRPTNSVKALKGNLEYHVLDLFKRGDYSQGMSICDSPLVSVIGLL